MPAAGFQTTWVYEYEGMPISIDLIIDASTIDFYLWHNPVLPFSSATKPGYMSSEKHGTSSVERPVSIIAPQTQLEI